MSLYELNPPRQKGVNLEGLGGWERDDISFGEGQVTWWYIRHSSRISSHLVVKWIVLRMSALHTRWPVDGLLMGWCAGLGGWLDQKARRCRYWRVMSQIKDIFGTGKGERMDWPFSPILGTPRTCTNVFEHIRHVYWFLHVSNHVCTLSSFT